MTQLPDRCEAGARSAGREAHPALVVHLLSGLPSPGNEATFARLRESLAILSLGEAPAAVLDRVDAVGIQLPPHVEPGALVDAWEDGVFLSDLFRRPAVLASVVVLVDPVAMIGWLDCGDSLAQRGWGRHALDVRTVADLAVEQIERATHLAFSGKAAGGSDLARRLELLNPTAERLVLGEASISGRSTRVTPAWLELLRSDPFLERAFDRPDHLLYRRARPFDPERLGEWLAAPPRGLLRGKGRIWLGNEWALAFGYSCAGPVHRLFSAGAWWAAKPAGTWPSCPVQQRDLLARWHPRFGDRRQELVLVGPDLDREAIAETLDACLVDPDPPTSPLGADASRALGWSGRSEVH